MTEQPQSIETGKPNPISLRELTAMSKEDVKSFTGKLTKKENQEFYKSIMRAQLTLTKDERKELARITINKLQKIEQKTLGDKIDLGLAKIRLKSIDHERPPIFFRKFRQTPHIPKFLKDAKSPYLMNTPVLLVHSG